MRDSGPAASWGPASLRVAVAFGLRGLRIRFPTDAPGRGCAARCRSWTAAPPTSPVAPHESDGLLRSRSSSAASWRSSSGRYCLITITRHSPSAVDVADPGTGWPRLERTQRRLPLQRVDRDEGQVPRPPRRDPTEGDLWAPGRTPDFRAIRRPHLPSRAIVAWGGSSGGLLARRRRN
jgi:hypothetical protein